MNTPHLPDLSTIRFGAAYYLEYQQSDRLDEDLDLMREAGFTVIRVGESVWSTWEPRDGEFDLEWLQPVLDGAHARGIGVVLGTPTYAIPPWLQVKHPELAAHSATGTAMHWGSRQEVDYSQPLFRRYAERIIRAIVARYADHPAVIGFQVDNEPGMRTFHNPEAFRGFVDQLRDRYGDVDTLNREWGLTYWSHRLSSWDELWVPDGNSVPQYDLAWRRYQASITTEYIEWQASIVRGYASDEQFVTTCISYSRPSKHEVDLTANLDVTAANPYYGMQDHLAADRELAPIVPFATTGVWALFRQGDRAWASKQERFLVTETNVQSISGSEHNYPGYPGQLRLAALALISRGAAMIEYWHWHTLHFGAETYWGGVLPHSQRPGRVYGEVSEIGALLEPLGPQLEGFIPDADVAILYSTESDWALTFTPPLNRADRTAQRNSYDVILDSFYRGIHDAGGQMRFVHAQQLGGDPAAFASRHPVLVAAGFYVSTDEQLAFLRDYAKAGGHLIAGIRTGYADHEARARLEVAPGVLAESAGVWYEEYSNLDAPIPVVGSAHLSVGENALATRWADSLMVTDADVLVRYEHPEFGRFPAVTTRAHGEGRITYVGTVPDPTLAESIFRFAVTSPISGVWEHGPGVTVVSGTAQGRRVWFLSNWSSTSSWAVAPSGAVDVVSGLAVGDTARRVELAPWGSLILRDGRDAAQR